MCSMSGCLINNKKGGLAYPYMAYTAYLRRGSCAFQKREAGGRAPSSHYDSYYNKMYISKTRSTCH